MVNLYRLYQETQRNIAKAVIILAIRSVGKFFTYDKFVMVAMDSPSNCTNSTPWKSSGRIGGTFKAAMYLKSVYLKFVGIKKLDDPHIPLGHLLDLAELYQ